MFISVAPRETAAEKMNKFLDINPMVPRCVEIKFRAPHAIEATSSP